METNQFKDGIVESVRAKKQNLLTVIECVKMYFECYSDEKGILPIFKINRMMKSGETFDMKSCGEMATLWAYIFAIIFHEVENGEKNIMTLSIE